MISALARWNSWRARATACRCLPGKVVANAALQPEPPVTVGASGRGDDRLRPGSQNAGLSQTGGASGEGRNEGACDTFISASRRYRMLRMAARKSGGGQEKSLSQTS